MTVAILLIATVTGLGTWFLYSKYSEVEDQSVTIQTRVFRDAMGVLRDIRRLGFVLEEARAAQTDASIPVSDETIADVMDAFDFLYVRRDAMEKFASSDAEISANTKRIYALLDHIIATGDLAMDEPNPDMRALYLAEKPLMDATHGELFSFVDAQYRRQRLAVVGQVDTLKSMVVVAIGLLWVFAVICAVVVFLYQAELIEKRRRKLAENKATFLAYFDSLTGLSNRTGFHDACTKMMKKHPETVMMLFDIDDFKQTNDVYGHSAGDAVLAHIGKQIDRVIGEQGGVCARLGGDEFAAMLPGPMSSMRAASVSENVVRLISEPVLHENNQLLSKISIGIAFSNSIEFRDAPELSDIQRAADIALYRAKEQGKNTYAFFDKELAEIVARRHAIERGLDAALKTDGLHLVYQPQIDMKSGQIKGFEALARWIHDGKMVSPGEFIPVAESTGQVVDIDLWGLRKATHQLADWIKQGLMPVTISANLSPLHFRNDAIVGAVEAALRSSGLPPHLVTLEITESVLIDDLASVTVTLDRLRALGVRIALDDFGTGYSSLAYLRKLDVDFIKIDQSFVRDLETSSETEMILRAIVDIAQGLRKLLVVEGIETEGQSNLIRDLGCDYGQGYLFGRPLSVEDARAMIPELPGRTALVKAAS